MLIIASIAAFVLGAVVGAIMIKGLKLDSFQTKLLTGVAVFLAVSAGVLYSAALPLTDFVAVVLVLCVGELVGIITRGERVE